MPLTRRDEFLEDIVEMEDVSLHGKSVWAKLGCVTSASDSVGHTDSFVAKRGIEAAGFSLLGMSEGVDEALWPCWKGETMSTRGKAPAFGID